MPPENVRKPLVFYVFRGYKNEALGLNVLRPKYSIHIQTNQLVSFLSQLTGFCMNETLALNRLILTNHFREHPFSTYAKVSEKLTFLYQSFLLEDFNPF